MTEGSEGGGDDRRIIIPECKRYASIIDQTRWWTQRIPIGLGLCPWAGRSLRLDRLRIIVCDDLSPRDVGLFVRGEAQRLTEASVPEWSTTLVVCPHVPEWQDEFDIFDEYVQTFKAEQKDILANVDEKADDKSDPSEIDMLEQLTLVAFHPRFIRWRALPSNIGVGSAVISHRGMCGFEKSSCPYLATIIETENLYFGKRKIKVRFEDDGKEQYVPIDWLTSDEDGSPLSQGEPLPDNGMHQAPYPTIHLIRDTDLSALRARDVSRVKRKNAQLFSRIGWDGVYKRQDESCDDGDDYIYETAAHLYVENSSNKATP